jgi:tetratricopeptide (TPR) repeat protein
MGARPALTGAPRRSRHGLVSLLVATALVGPARGTAGADAWPGLGPEVDSLVAAGEWSRAAQVVEAASTVARAPWAPAWWRRELDRRRASFSAWSSLRAGGRDSLAAATSALLAARRATSRDSIAAAERLASDALDVRLALLGPGHESTAEAQLVLGQVAFVLAHVSLSDSLADAARRTFEARLGPDHPRVADAEQLLGRNLKNFTGRVARPGALAHYGRALRIRTAAFGAWSLEAGECHHELGNLERVSGDASRALRSFRRALEIRRRSLGVVDHQVAATLGAMAMLEAEHGRWAAAESLVIASLAASSPDARLAPRARAFRAGLLGQVLRQQGRAAEAVRWLGEALAIHEGVWAGMPRDEGSTVFSGLSLYFDLALALAGQGRTEEAFETLERGTSRTLLERALARGEGPPPPATLAEVQRVLAPDVALVSWVEARFGAGQRGEAWACIVRSEGPPRWVRLPGSIERLPGGQLLQGAFWGEMRSASRWPWRLDAGAPERTLAAAMGRAWFTPLEPWLVGARQLVVFSPDLCGGGPLAALSDSAGRPLIERFAISYAPSARLYALGLARARARPAPPHPAALVVADPAYGPAPGGWRPLAGSRREIEAVRGAVARATVLAGPEARARTLRELARRGQLERYALVHFATHTEFDDLRALESALVLAPDVAGEPQSRVTAREIASGWRLDADLVCLSGCESAAGMRAASQGRLGLQQAMLRAGARSVLVSMWPVDDGATALLMRQFYGRLAAGSGPGARSEALRAAQDAVRRWRDADGSCPWAHPAYWAGFTLIGDPG